MSVIPFRAPDGRFAGADQAEPRPTLEQARVLYQAYLAAVCLHQGLRPSDVARELARPGKTYFDTTWRAAVYARQLALYLTNTSHNVPQTMLAEICQISPSTVCKALRAIEDVRDVATFDQAVDLVAATMGAN